MLRLASPRISSRTRSRRSRRRRKRSRPATISTRHGRARRSRRDHRPRSRVHRAGYVPHHLREGTARRSTPRGRRRFRELLAVGDSHGAVELWNLAADKRVARFRVHYGPREQQRDGNQTLAFFGDDVIAKLQPVRLGHAAKRRCTTPRVASSARSRSNRPSSPRSTFTTTSGSRLTRWAGSRSSDTKRGSVLQSWNGHDARVVASQDYAVAVLAGRDAGTVLVYDRAMKQTELHTPSCR